MTDMPPVHPALAEALAKKGYDTLTEVQTAASAPEHAGKDLLVSAQTGSGKTVAFGLSMAADILGETPKFGKGGNPRAIIVAPTRELAMQVKRELDWLYGPANAKIASCVGGMDQRDERRALKGGVHIVVGTPGRLADHIRKGNLDTSEIAVVVLDEADEMLDMGFRDELEEILSETPETRRTLLFSATVPRGIANLAKRYQKDAVRLKTSAEASQHLDIDYQALSVANGDEEAAIVNLLRYSDSPSALVFCATRAAVARLMTRLNNRGLSVVALSGELSQKERTNALQALRDGRARVCVATDVAARGLDLKTLDLVIHAEIPRNAEALKHRSGRTGRAGRKGMSALIVTPKMKRRTQRLLQDAKIDAKWTTPPSAEDILAKDDAKLLANPALQTPVAESEAALVAGLLEQHSPEQIAAAFIRQHRADRSAPEDLRRADSSAPQKLRDRPERGPREPRESHKDFGDAAWVSLSVGRRKNAEPRWLIPMLCKHGGLTARDIGAIRVNQNDTAVQLKSDAAKRFFAALEADGTLEKGVYATPLDAAPEAPERRPRRDSRDDNRNDRRNDRGDRDSRPPRTPRKPRGDAKFRKDAPAATPKPGKQTIDKSDYDPLTAYLEDDREIVAKKRSIKPPRVKPGAKGGDAPFRKKPAGKGSKPPKVGKPKRSAAAKSGAKRAVKRKPD